MTEQAVEVEQLLGELGDALHRYRARRRQRLVRISTAATAAAVVAVAAGATYGVLWSVSPPFRSVKTPLTLPQFNGRDILSGRRIDNSDIAGRAGFVIVWQSYCHPCIPDLAAVQAFVAANPKTPVIGLDVNDLPAYAKKVIREMHITFPSVAADLTTIRPLGIVGFPTVLAFDAHGKVIATAAGSTTSPDVLIAALKRLASG